MIFNEKTQLCRECKEEKSIDLFFKVKSSKLGYSTKCKSCTSISAKEYWSKNKSKIAEQRKHFRADNSERLNRNSKEWHINNKEWAAEYNIKYREDNKEKIKETNRKYREDNKEILQQRAWEYRENNKDFLAKRAAEYRSDGKGAEIFKRYRGRHPKRFKARCAVYIALKNNTLIRPDKCEECGIKCKPDAHHKDYNHQLEVDFLCKPCHGLWHRNNKVIG